MPPKSDLSRCEPSSPFVTRSSAADTAQPIIRRERQSWNTCAYSTALDFSRPGRPADNGHIETFNGSLRNECLNVHWFDSLAEAEATIEAWRRDYNESRPRRDLADLALAEYARRLGHTQQLNSLITAGD